MLSAKLAEGKLRIVDTEKVTDFKTKKVAKIIDILLYYAKWIEYYFIIIQPLLSRTFPFSTEA